MTDPKLRGIVRAMLEDPAQWSARSVPRHRLYRYQAGPVRAIAGAVHAGAGGSFAVVFSRQAGKDESIAQLVAFLLTRYQKRGGSVVLAAPTMGQAGISQARLIARLREAPLSARSWWQRDNVVGVGTATARFLSAEASANPRGATADLLLIANEAQDIDPGIWQARFDPMAASTDAVTVFMGTVWDDTGLLAQAMGQLAGGPNLFLVPWREVERERAAYGRRVRRRIGELGEGHPFIKTEYELVPLSGEGGLFPPARLAQLRGEHPRRRSAESGKRYAVLVDVAGEEEEGAGPGGWDAGSKRDATALTVVEVDTGGRELPVYRVVDRMAWTGQRHTVLHAQIMDLIRNVWKASAVVIDATGVGAGLASFLGDHLGRGLPRVAVEPFVFTGASKSALGWDVIGLIDSGRLKEYADDGEALTAEAWRQLAAVTFEVMPGPGRLLRWSVPTSRGHDDLVMSLALTARLDQLDWRDRTARGTAGLGL